MPVFEPIIFGKYLLTERIAVGGMAEIFRAKVFGVDGFEKPMVVKQILPQYARYKEFVDMFIDEAKITVSLGHGNIVPVYELGRIDGIYFIAMEYVDGQDLSMVMARARELNSPPTGEMSAAVCIDILKGLDYAHRRKDSRGRPMGIVHRDVSPQNIMISYDGEVKILDFGIAKAARKLVETRPGSVKGKFGYISPEQASGKPVDKRTDIFSVGIILWELLTLDRLFEAESDLDSLDMVIEHVPEKPSVKRPGVPEAIDEIVLKALQKDPEERYKDAAAFQLSLSKYLYASRQAITSEDTSRYIKTLFQPELEEAKKVQRHEEDLVERYREKMAKSVSAVRSASRSIAGMKKAPTDPGRSQRAVSSKSPLPAVDRENAVLAEAFDDDKPKASSRPGSGPAGLSSEQKKKSSLSGLPVEYEVFAVKDGPDDVDLEVQALRSSGSHIVWAVTVLLLLGVVAYLLLSRTDVSNRISGRSKEKQKADARQVIEDQKAIRSMYYGRVRLRTDPPNASGKSGLLHWPRFYLFRGKGPCVVDIALKDSDVELLVEKEGLHPLQVRVTTDLFQPMTSPGKSATHQASIEVDLNRPDPPKGVKVFKGPPGSSRPGFDVRGRLTVKTTPEGANVWLYLGYTVEMEDVDPGHPMRFMVALHGYGPQFISLRPFRSRKEPGLWSPDPEGPQFLRFERVVKMLPKQSPTEKTFPGRSR